jgi:hypothetical protein
LHWTIAQLSRIPRPTLVELVDTIAFALSNRSHRAHYSTPARNQSLTLLLLNSRKLWCRTSFAVTAQRSLPHLLF